MNLLASTFAANVAVIGGSEGPTAIYVTYVSSPFPIASVIAIAAGAILMTVAAVIAHRS